MDANLREMGISDQGVPRQMKKVGEAFYGRSRAYDAALDAGEGLAEALVRNVHAGENAQVAATHLATYVMEATRHLQAPAAGRAGQGASPISDPVLAAEQTR